MVDSGWSVTKDERRVLSIALDALLPPEGSFPAPSQTDVIDTFILRQIPSAGTQPVPYPGLDADSLRALLARLAPASDPTAALTQLEAEEPALFLSFWRLAVYGYYSRTDTIGAIQRDLAPAYHGAPLPLGYAHAIAPWDPADPLQNPQHRRGSYTPTAAVRRADLTALPTERAEGERS